MIDCKQIKKELTNELTFSSEMKNIFLQSSCVGLFVFLSIFWKWFVIVAVVLSCWFILLNLNGKSIYFLFFLLPLISILKLEADGFYLLPIVAAFLIMVLGIKLLINIIKKKEKINWTVTIFLSIFILYLLIQLDFSNMRNFLSLLLGLAFLYVAYYYVRDIKFKELAFIFLLGMIFSVFIGLFRPINDRLQIMIDAFVALGEPRFSASAQNVNIFAGELMILLAMFTALFVKKDIKYSFYIIYFISLILITSTISKSALIIFLFLTLVFIIYSIIDQKKKCYINLIGLLICFILAFTIFYDMIYTCFFRLFSNNSTIVSNASQGLSNLTTGRFDIWIVYFKEIFSSAKNALFGLGMSAPNIGVYQDSSNFTTHNTFVSILYNVGIVGMVLFLCLIFSFIGWKKVFKLKFPIVIMIISIALFLSGLDFFSYRLSNYILIIMSIYASYNEKAVISDVKILNTENQL